MSAADLFKDAYDVEFRLRSTFLTIGREVYFVDHVSSVDSTPKKAVLDLQSLVGDKRSLLLGRLPLRAMFACPSGYYDGLWLTRGPTRHRYQGITRSSFWCVAPNGRIEPYYTEGCFDLLTTLVHQPRLRPLGKRSQGVITRDVYINSNKQVLVRGRLLCEYLKNNKVQPLNELSPLSRQLLANARLDPIDQAAKEFLPTIKENLMEIPLC